MEKEAILDTRIYLGKNMCFQLICWPQNNTFRHKDHVSSTYRSKVMKCWNYWRPFWKKRLFWPPVHIYGKFGVSSVFVDLKTVHLDTKIMFLSQLDQKLWHVDFYWRPFWNKWPRGHNRSADGNKTQYVPPGWGGGWGQIDQTATSPWFQFSFVKVIGGQMSQLKYSDSMSTEHNKEL